MKLNPTNITDVMVEEFSSWKYAEDYVPIMTMDSIKRHMPQILDSEIRDKEFIAYCDEKNNRFLGWCRGRFFNVRELDIIYLGFAIHPEFQGQGLGEQILKKSFPIFHSRYGVYPFMVDVEAVNIRSKKLVEKLGFRFMYTVDNDDCGEIKKTDRLLLELEEINENKI